MPVNGHRGFLHADGYAGFNNLFAEDRKTGKFEIMRTTRMPHIGWPAGHPDFVVRTISDQVKDVTFSRTSPLRHTLRVALGSIVGVVVATFYGTPTAVSLSASAWAFVSGYAMEAVFATFDTLASKLKS